MSENARKYYDDNPEREWDRLVQDGYHRLEYIVTRRSRTSGEDLTISWFFEASDIQEESVKQRYNDYSK